MRKQRRIGIAAAERHDLRVGAQDQQLPDRRWPDPFHPVRELQAQPRDVGRPLAPGHVRKVSALCWPSLRRATCSSKLSLSNSGTPSARAARMFASAAWIRSAASIAATDLGVGPDDDAVVVADHQVTGVDLDSADGDRHLHLGHALGRRGLRGRAAGEDRDGQAGQRVGVSAQTVDHHPGQPPPHGLGPEQLTGHGQVLDPGRDHQHIAGPAELEAGQHRHQVPVRLYGHGPAHHPPGRPDGPDGHRQHPQALVGIGQRAAWPGG